MILRRIHVKMKILFKPTTAARYSCLGLLYGAFAWNFLTTTLEYLSYPVVVHISLQDPKYTPIPYFSVCFDLREYISLEKVYQNLPLLEQKQRGVSREELYETIIKNFPIRNI